MTTSLGWPRRRPAVPYPPTILWPPPRPPVRADDSSYGPSLPLRRLLLARESRRRRVRGVPLVELDVPSSNRTVSRPGSGGVSIAQVDGELVVVPAGFAVVSHLHFIGVPVDTIDTAGSLDETGPLVDEDVGRDARSVHLHRRGRAVIVVFEMTPEGPVLDAAAHTEVRVDPGRETAAAPPDDDAAAGHEITRDLDLDPSPGSAAGERQNHHGAR